MDVRRSRACSLLCFHASLSLSHHPPHPSATTTFQSRIHARPIRRQAPTGGPLPESLDLVARSDRHGDDETAAMVVRSLLAVKP